jgi:hypothetical protein
MKTPVLRTCSSSKPVSGIALALTVSGLRFLSGQVIQDDRTRSEGTVPRPGGGGVASPVEQLKTNQ